MAYKQIVYLRAKAELESRRKKAESENDARRLKAISLCPEIERVEGEIASYGLDAVKALGMGGDAEKFIRELSLKSLAAQEKKKQLLRSVGLDEDYLDIKYTCPICKDTGSHDGYFCDCQKKEVVAQAKALLGETTPVKKCTFEKFSLNYYPDVIDPSLGVSQREHMQTVFNFCRDYANHFTKKAQGLIMYGGTGLGKTHLSLAIANVVIERGYDVYYGSVQSIMEKLEKEHFGRKNTEESEKDAIVNADLLIIDDLGVEFATQFTTAALHDILNTRMLKGLPTIISTNLEMDEIYEKYTQRIASRLFGSSLPLAFCGKDIRQRK